jgi:hypothetical protein
MKKRGIILIAAGHINYTRMARNLAISLKANDPNVKISLIHSEPIPEGIENEGLFDQFIQAPVESYHTFGVTQYFKLKTWLYTLTPYDESLYLDVDMVWIKGRKPSDLMESLSDVEFSMANYGYTTIDKGADSFWADVNEVKKAWNLTDEKWYSYSSEIMWFKKSKDVKKYFDKAKSIYENPKVKTLEFGGSQMADELAFMIASSITGMFPHQDKWQPIFWHHKQPGKKNLAPYQLAQDFWAYSMGGNGHPTNIIANYNSLVNHYCNILGFSNSYLWKDKKTYLNTRVKI